MQWPRKALFWHLIPSAGTFPSHGWLLMWGVYLENKDSAQCIPTCPAQSLAPRNRPTKHVMNWRTEYLGVCVEG